MPTREGSVRLFRLWGIDVFLHWSWLIVAFFQVSNRMDVYRDPLWKVAEYLTLFGIVLLHEFGHSLACRQTGGKADTIVLWPLGGVAYITPPPRPGAVLWSIVAGPLVNVGLGAVLWVSFRLLAAAGLLDGISDDASTFLGSIFRINLLILIFNLLPVYPLDGGQILRCLLWFFIGPARSLWIAAVLGLVGVAGGIVWAVTGQRIWLGIMAVFAGMNCWRALQASREMLAFARRPRHEAFRCPACQASPALGEYWVCPQCQQTFDLFGSDLKCPRCMSAPAAIPCPHCGEVSAADTWRQ